MLRSLILILIVVFFISSCAPAAITSVENGLPAVKITSSPGASLVPPTQVPINAALYTPTLHLAVATLINLPASPTLPSCLQTSGRVQPEKFNTDLLPEPLVYRVYLPPCYDEQIERSYPVLYLVHGKNASDMQWDYLGVPETLDRLVANGELPPFIVVMPRDRKWTEPTADNFGLALVQTLVPWVDEHYRTLPEREYRAIGGLSWGGAWALHIGFSYPELFGSVGSHSGIVFSTDVTNFYQWVDGLSVGTAPRIYLDIGDKDRADTIAEISWVENLLTQHDIAHEWHLYEGKHDDTYWRAHVEEYLRWYSQEWGDEPGLNNR